MAPLAFRRRETAQKSSTTKATATNNGICNNNEDPFPRFPREFPPGFHHDPASEGVPSGSREGVPPSVLSLGAWRQKLSLEQKPAQTPLSRSPLRHSTSTTSAAAARRTLIAAGTSSVWQVVGAVVVVDVGACTDAAVGTAGGTISPLNIL